MTHEARLEHRLVPLQLNGRLELIPQVRGVRVQAGRLRARAVQLAQQQLHLLHSAHARTLMLIHTQFN